MKKKGSECAGRESNPGLVRGRDVYYHCTTGADITVVSQRLHSVDAVCVICDTERVRTDCSRSYGAMAARWILDPKVGGSNPSSFIFFFYCVC